MRSKLVSFQGAGILLTMGTPGRTTTADTTGAVKYKSCHKKQIVRAILLFSFDKFDLNRSDHPYTSLQAANPASSFEFEHSEISINHSKVKTISTNMICETR